MADPAAWLAQYEALTGGVACVDFSQRTMVEIAGDDCRSFLHNFCTNDIRNLPPAAGCEAFITSVQGKVLAHVFVFSAGTSLVLETVAGQAERIIGHLDRYLIREKVTLIDRSHQWSELFVAGKQSEPLLYALMNQGPPAVRLESSEAVLAGVAVCVRRVDMTVAAGFLLQCQSSDLPQLLKRLQEAGAIDCGAEAFEAARIEAGFPFYGADIGEQNLAQEAGRERQAISFTKGCYLGQETVARIDALGHVNRSLAGVRFAVREIPPRGAELTAAGQVVGHVTSATFSPRLQAPLALAYLRRGSNAPGTQLTWHDSAAEVIALPIG